MEALQDEGCAKLEKLDVRWNKMSKAHSQSGKGLSADARVDADPQKQQTAADRQTAYLNETFQQSKAAGQQGKKVHVPKWVREQQKAKEEKHAAAAAAAASTAAACNGGPASPPPSPPPSFAAAFDAYRHRGSGPRGCAFSRL